MTVPPFQEIHIENTNSCGYTCVMCPRESQTRPIGFMPLTNFSLLLDRIGRFRGLVHLHGFGEPLLDRKLKEKIELLNKRWPSAKSLIFSTLGVKQTQEDFLQLLEAGLHSMVISLYGFTRNSYQAIHRYDGLERVKQNLQSLSRAMNLFSRPFRAIIKIPGSGISSSLLIPPSPDQAAFCNWARELGFEIGEWTYLHNYSNGRTYNRPNREKLCPVIHGNRKVILNITWDLDVIPCCYDFNATIRFGNLQQQTLEEIFSSPEYLSFVLAHQTQELSAYPVCQNCEKSDYA